MKILLDEDVPHPLVRALPQRHVIRTVAAMGWAGVKNGELLKRTEAERFEVFVTGDKNLAKQQELSNRPFAVLVLSAINWAVIRKHVEAISAAIDGARPGTLVIVDCGVFVPRRRARL